MTLKTLKQACTPRASTFDSARRDTVLDLVDLAEGRIDGTGNAKDRNRDRHKRRLFWCRAWKCVLLAATRPTVAILAKTGILDHHQTHHELARRRFISHNTSAVDGEPLGAFLRASLSTSPLALHDNTGADGAIADDIDLDSDHRDQAMTIKPIIPNQPPGSSSSKEDGLFARFILFAVQGTTITIMSVMLIGLVIFAGVSFFQFVAPIALSAFVGVKVAFLALANLVIEEDWLRQFTWQQTAKHIAFGFGVGLLIGFIRLKFGRRYGQARLVECFVDSFGDPIAVQAAGVSNACLALHVIVSVAISLGLEALGVTFSYGLTGGVGAASPLADAFISIAGGSGPPGGGPGSYGALSGIMVLLFAIILLIFIVSFLAGVISHLAIALASGKVVSMSAVAAGAIQGAQASVGRTIGIAFVMALTRQSMPEVARHLPEVRTKPDFERELREFRFRGNVTSAESQPLYKALDAFKSWRQTYHPNLTIEGYDACVKEYAMPTAWNGRRRGCWLGAQAACLFEAFQGMGTSVQFSTEAADSREVATAHRWSRLTSV